MTNNDTNNLSEYIDLFLDGEINATEQTILFKALANDEELQSEFNSAVKMRNAIDFDKTNIVPSNTLKSSLFAKAGLDSSVLMQPVANIEAQQMTNGLSTFSIASISSLITLLTFGGILYFSDVLQFKNSDEITRNQIESSTQSLVSTNLKNKDKESHSNNNIPYNLSSEPIKKAIYSKPLSIINHNDSINADRQIIANKEVYKDNLTVENSHPALNLNQFLFQNMNLQHDQLIEINEATSNFYEKFSLTVLGMQSLQAIKSETAKSSFMSNIGLILEYDLNERHKLLFAIANEEFPLYEIISDELVPQSNILWVGLGYKYLAQDYKFLKYFTPMIQTTLGLSKYGFVSKNNIGINFRPEQNLSVSLAIDYSGFTFQNKSGIELGKKLGLIYGLTYSF